MFKNRRVLLLRKPSLLAEGVERLLRQMEEVELIGPWDLNARSTARLAEASPDLIVIAEEDADAPETGSLINRIMEQHPDLPIVRIGMRQNTIRLYTSRALPAHTAELAELIRNLPLHHLGGGRTEGVNGLPQIFTDDTEAGNSASNRGRLSTPSP